MFGRFICICVENIKYSIGVVGATGLVGRKTLEMLSEYGLENNKFFLFASKKSVGKRLKIGQKYYNVQNIENISNYGLDFALFCTPENVSELYAKKLAKLGTKVIDFSSLYRKDFPLIVPEINFCKMQKNIICNPNCSTIIGTLALSEIHKKYGLTSINYSTYQALSGAGKNALGDQKIKENNNLKKLDYVIQNNLLPYIGELGEDGRTKEENKMIFETKKILNDESICVNATCVRVNVDVCHSESITFTTRHDATISDIEKCLKNTKNVVYVANDFSRLMPIYVKNRSQVFVGRLRKCQQKNTYSIFVVGDNLRKGAAQNGVQILCELIKEQNANI